MMSLDYWRSMYGLTLVRRLTLACDFGLTLVIFILRLTLVWTVAYPRPSRRPYCNRIFFPSKPPQSIIPYPLALSYQAATPFHQNDIQTSPTCRARLHSFNAIGFVQF